MSPYAHDLVLIFATTFVVILLQRLGRQALYAFCGRWLDRMQGRIALRRRGQRVDRPKGLDGMLTPAEEEAFGRLMDGDVDKTRMDEVYADWRKLRDAYDRITGRVV